MSLPAEISVITRRSLSELDRAHTALCEIHSLIPGGKPLVPASETEIPSIDNPGHHDGNSKPRRSCPLVICPELSIQMHPRIDGRIGVSQREMCAFLNDGKVFFGSVVSVRQTIERRGVSVRQFGPVKFCRSTTVLPRPPCHCVFLLGTRTR